MYPQGLVTPGVQAEMTDPEFWVQNTPHAGDVILDPWQIQDVNRLIAREVDTVYELARFPEVLTGKELAGYITAYRLPGKTMYSPQGVALGREFYDSVLENVNLKGIRDENPVASGVTIKKTSLRSFPTAEGIYEGSDSVGLDRFQETGIQACEPVLMLHRSLDLSWYFVQTYNYRGWVRSDDIALVADRKTLFEYLDGPRFLVVTGNWIQTESTPGCEEDVREFDMGARLPMAATGCNGRVFVVRLPARDKDGSLRVEERAISAAQDVSQGYLPYTRANLIRQAFKLQGDRYDWGDKFKGRDCSSYVYAIYRTLGFNLPRNTRDQEKVPFRVMEFKKGDSLNRRDLLLNGLSPGALLYMPGHVMVYLGKYRGVPYAIHNFSGYTLGNGKVPFIPVYQVAVTTLMLPSSLGIPFLAMLTSAVDFGPPDNTC